MRNWNINSALVKALELYGNRVHHRGQWWVHPKIRKLLRIDCNRDVEVTRGGLRWRLNPADHIQADLFWLGEYESWDSFHIRRLLPRECTLFDVGANFGYYSLSICRILSGNCRIYAFEPSSLSYERLSRNIRMNSLQDHIHAYRIALCDFSGTGYVLEWPGNSGGDAIALAGGDEPVALTTLDEFCQSEKVNKIDFIKIDVEGFEERVLRGAENSIHQFRPVMLVELNPPTLRRQNSSVESLVDRLKSHHYRLCVANRRRLEPLRQLPHTLDYVNAFCFPEERAKDYVPNL